MTGPPVRSSLHVVARGSVVARETVTVSITVSQRAFPVYTDARCPHCNRRIMSLPGSPILEPKIVENEAARSGRGIAVACPSCRRLVEVIVHG